MSCFVNRLHTALTRQDNRDKKDGAKVTTGNYYDSYRVDNMETENTHLKAKVGSYI